MKFPQRGAALAAAVLVTTLALTGCSPSGDDPSAEAPSERGGTLTLQSQGSPVSLDNVSGTPNALLMFWQPVYDSLLFQEPDGTIAAGLATEWAYNDDRTQLTLSLRDDVEFTDGTPLDAAAVKTNLERLRDGNAPESGTVARIEGIDASDAHTVVLDLSEPDPGLERALTNVAGYIASPAAIEDETLEGSPIGSGPYIYNAGESVVGSSYVYDRNPDYWNPDLQHYEKLVITVLGDASATLNALISGQVNAALMGTKQWQAAESAGMELVEIPPLNSILMLFDRAGQVQPELADVRVRQAINYAINKDEFIDVIYEGKAAPSGQVFPPESSAFVPELDDAYAYDPAKARALLADAGLAEGFTLTLPANTAFDPTVNTVLEQYLKDVGITVNWASVAPTEFFANISRQTYAATWSVTAQRGTWEDYNRMIAPTGLYNPFHSEDAKIADLAHVVQTDPENADEAAQDLNRYVSDQAWFAPIARYEQAFFVDQKTAVVPSAFRSVPDIYSYEPR